MRRKRAVEALFSATRQAILGAILLEPGRSWYLSDLAAHLGRRHPSSLQRELESLAAAEILIRRKEGNRVYYEANRDCPIYPELVGLLAKTAGLAEIVRAAIKPLRKRIKLAFIHGSVARHEERATSDVDLVVVGDLGLSDVSGALRGAEDRLSRAVNATVYSESEVTAKVAAGHHFLRAVLQGEKIFLIGSQHELEELASGLARAAPRYEQAGAR
jgi:predicted nucleotidyltransferase